MKKILLPILTTLALSIQAAELTTFSEVANAVSQGKQLTFVVALNACQPNLSTAEIKISIRPNAIMLIDGKRVTASDKHFTLDEPMLPGKPAIDYSKFNINADGSVGLQITVMDAKDYHLVTNQKLNCELGKGLQVFDDNSHS